jgi:hypothetical protein
MVINRHILIILILISALGVVAIPFGNPKFIGEVIIVQFCYISEKKMKVLQYLRLQCFLLLVVLSFLHIPQD